jgi:hypothetical protein
MALVLSLFVLAGAVFETNSQIIATREVAYLHKNSHARLVM